MTWGAVAGAGVSLVGGLLGSKKAPKAPVYSPYDVRSGLGTADYSRGQLNLSLSPEQQAYANQYGGLASQYLGGGFGGQQAQDWMQQAGGQIPGLFQGALGASGVDQNSLAQYLSGLGGVQGQMGGMFGAAGQAGLNVLGGQQPGLAQSNAMFGLGQQLAGNQYSDVYNQRLGLLREQAAPYEERAQNAFLNKQYAMGRMGGTGGGRDVEAFSRGLGQADTTRQLDAMNLSEALYGRDQALAQGYMGQGLQGLLGGFGAQASAGQGLLGMGGQLGGSLANMYGAGYGSQQGFNELVNARAQQRMMNAQNLFGFGGQTQAQNIGLGQGLQAAQTGLWDPLYQQAQFGHQSGVGTSQASASAYANQRMNPMAAALQGFGNSVMANPGMLGGMFGGGGGRTGSYTPGNIPLTMQPMSLPTNIPMPQFNFGG